MSTTPITIDHHATLAVARRLIESAAKLDPDTVRVDRVMTPKPFVVTGDVALDEITEVMAEHKYSSVVVMGRNGVEGIFTAVDACQALTTMLRVAVAET